MAGACCASEGQSGLLLDKLEAHSWSRKHFGGARLNDRRLSRRLVQMAAAMVESPGMSLPHQMTDWAALNGAYRFLSHPKIDSTQLLEPHLQQTRGELSGHPLVLCIHDDSQLDFTCRTGIDGLGMTGDGEGRGLHLHACLAVLPERSLAGLLDLRFCTIEKNPPGETRRQRQSRKTLMDAWPDAVKRIGSIGERTRLIHMGDCAADMFLFMHAARSAGQGFLVRSSQNRWIDGDSVHLEEKIAGLPLQAHMTICVPVRRSRGNQIMAQAREAMLELRFTKVGIPPSCNDPRTRGLAGIDAWAIELKEVNPPEGIKEPIYWRLLTSDPVETLEDALRMVRYYTYRWVIEEYFRGYKEGCRIEASQLDNVEDIKRLGTILSVVAVRLMQLRDLADPHEPRVRLVEVQEAGAPEGRRVVDEGAIEDLQAARRDDPAALRKLVPPLFITVAARLAGVKEDTLTPRKFLLEVARRGGYLNRKNDPRPGWRALWHGWYRLTQMVQGAELIIKSQADDL